MPTAVMALSSRPNDVGTPDKEHQAMTTDHHVREASHQGVGIVGIITNASL
jgi:hypothetical protein